MFDIAFLLDEPLHHAEAGTPGAWGRTCLGLDFEEHFIAPLDRWTRADDERQWVEAGRRLMDGGERTAFVLEAGWLWWTAWRDAERVIVQQRLLVEDRMASAWVAPPSSVPYDLVGARETHNEDGVPLSEWQMSMADVRAFVERRARLSGTAG